jgi:hypothetical protein
VKRGFPNLAWVDADRFDFEIYNHRGLWVRVMEDAWELLNRDPPLVWVIKIRELPEERQERKSTYSSLGVKARYCNTLTRQVFKNLIITTPVF